jgi:hypothetical protein
MKRKEKEILNIKDEALLLRHCSNRRTHIEGKEIILGQKSGNNKKITFSSPIIFLTLWLHDNWNL